MNELKEIIFVDSLTSINEIENFSIKLNTKFITFDYDSHLKLKNRKIEHEISEKYLIDDVSKLQKQCYEFLNWNDLDIVKNNIKFFNINICKLYNDQLIHPIVKILKKFSEIKTIVDKYPNSKYLASGDLLLITRLLDQSVIEIPNAKKNKFYFDEIELSTNIGKKKIKFSISNSLFKKIKNISEKILYIALQNKNKNLTKKNTLLVELNTKSFKKFFLESKNHNKNIIYYGRRRPGIWDIESFKIIKNSQCKIITSDIINKNTLKIYKKEFVEIRKKILEILEHNSELSNFFSVENISLISVISPIIKFLIVERLDEIMYEIVLAKHVFDEFNIDSIIVISEIGMTEQIIIEFGNQKKIPILHLQEGLHIDTQEAFENSKSQGVFLQSANKYVAWGKFSKENQITIGKVSPKDVIELGSPRFSELNFLDNKNSEEFVLLATMPPQIEEINGIYVQNLEKYLDSILKICEIVTNHKMKMRIKLHPTSDILNISEILQKKFPEIQVIKKGDINSLIRRSSIVIVTGFSTVIIQSQILQKPVISIPLIDYNWGKPSVYTENSCLLIELDQLSMYLKKINNDVIFKNELISNANIFLKKCIKNKEDSSELIWKYIKELIINKN